MPRTPRFGQQTSAAVYARHRHNIRIGGGIGGRGGRAIIADRRYHRHALVSRQSDCSRQQRIIGSDQAHRDDFDPARRHPPQRSHDREGAAARRIIAIHVRHE